MDLNDEDTRLRKEFQHLVNNVIKNESLAISLSNLKMYIRTSVTSESADPKVLKYLKDSYEPLKDAYAQLAESSEKRSLAEVISVLTLTRPVDDQRKCLEYYIESEQENPADWGHQYVERLHIEVVEEWLYVPCDDDCIDNEIGIHILQLIKKILEYYRTHNREIQACKLCLEINEINFLENIVDEHNYKKICLYLTSVAAYTKISDRPDIYKEVVSFYLRFKDYSRALLIALQNPDLSLAKLCWTNCQDLLTRRQLAFIFARQKIKFDRKKKSLVMKTNYMDVNATDDMNEIENILSNSYMNKYFSIIAQNLNIAKPIALNKICSWVFDYPQISNGLICLSNSLASAFVHVGLKVDAYVTCSISGWACCNEDIIKLTITASLGLIHYWDLIGGLNKIDKYINSTSIGVKAGRLLAIGILSSSVNEEGDLAKDLLTNYMTSREIFFQIGSILGLGIAYAGTNRTDISNLIIQQFNNMNNSVEVTALSATALGLINVGSQNKLICDMILNRFSELSDFVKNNYYSRFFLLAVSLIFLGSTRINENLIDTCDNIPEPYSLILQSMLIMCSYVGTNERHEKEYFENMFNEYIPPTGHSFVEIYNYFIHSIAILGLAVTGLNEYKEKLRFFNQIERIGHPEPLIALPLALALMHLSTGNQTVVDKLIKLSYNNNHVAAMNAIFAIGLVGAGTNNARIAEILKQLAIYYLRNPKMHFMISISEGLLKLGKGLITLQPYKFDSKILDITAMAGILVVLIGLLDNTFIVVERAHYLFHCLSLAMEPRWLVTINENCELLPVSVRVGQPVDVTDEAGEPKTINGGNVNTTPVILAHGEKAELVNSDEYEPLIDPMEGFVILRAKT